MRRRARPNRSGRDARSLWVVAALLLLASTALGACSLFRRQKPDAEGRPGGSGVEMRAPTSRPRISLVAREGDPASGVAVAVTHDLDAVQSTALAALVQARIQRRGAPEAMLETFGGGLVVRALSSSATTAARFVTAAAASLAEPVSPADMAAVGEALSRLSVPRWGGPADAAVDECTGELGTNATERPRLGPAALLERTRQAVVSTRSVAFAAVGPRAVLDASAAALESTPPWPTDEREQDPWPAQDVFGVSLGRVGGRTLSVATRIGEGARALEAANALGHSRSALQARLAALEPAWRVERSAGALRPRGACVRLDLSSETEPRVGEAISAAQVALEELRAAVAGASGSRWSVDAPVLRPSDPSRAAAVAAWHALSGRLEAGSPRYFASYRVSGPGDATASARFVSAMRAASQRRGLEVMQRRETGQGELWLLLASTCGTASETTATAGLTTLLLRTLAAKHPEREGVRIEPWTGTDGLGLIAHAPRRSADETDVAHAARVARALGWALATTRIHEADAAVARAAVQTELDAEREPLLSIALDALAPGHPSWLDPRGTWQSVSAQSGHQLDAHRRTFLRTPLRLAMLTNDASEQAMTATSTLERWLMPLRDPPSACPVASSVAARPGEYTVATNATPKPSARALVGVPFVSSPVHGIPTEAEWTVLLLNRRGGWLDRALNSTGLATHSQAMLLGGRNAGAIIIELSALGADIRPPVAQVRGLLSRLADGATTNDDALFARRLHAQHRVQGALDPRRRLIELWRGVTRRSAADLASLRSFHQNALGAARHVVVVGRARE